MRGWKKCCCHKSVKFSYVQKIRKLFEKKLKITYRFTDVQRVMQFHRLKLTNLLASKHIFMFVSFHQYMKLGNALWRTLKKQVGDYAKKEMTPAKPEFPGVSMT